MSLFQCEHCGCAENTALTSGHMKFMHQYFDFTGIECRFGKRLCSACTPKKMSDGEANDESGEWHGQFDRVYLPIGEFFTNAVGNLAHKATGDENYRKFAIKIEAATKR